jgi:hypothetical protein
MTNSVKMHNSVHMDVGPIDRTALVSEAVPDPERDGV